MQCECMQLQSKEKYGLSGVRLAENLSEDEGAERREGDLQTASRLSLVSLKACTEVTQHLMQESACLTTGSRTLARSAPASQRWRLRQDLEARVQRLVRKHEEMFGMLSASVDDLNLRFR